MSHSDTIKGLPTGGVRLASTADVENAAYRIEGEDTYFCNTVSSRGISHDGWKTVTAVKFLSRYCPM